MSKDFNSTLAAAIKEVEQFNDKNKQNIKGKKYMMVKDRSLIFRKHFGLDARITTEQTYDDNFVRSESTVWIGGEIVANGFAEEKRDASFINKTSAAEVAETSSIGRALANLGLQGGEYASANEVENAIHQQKQQPKDDDAVTSKAGKVNAVGNKANSSRVLPEQSLPPGWDKMEKAARVQYFAADMNEATQPGNLRERATRYEAWIARLPDNDREEIMGMYNTRKQEILNKEVKS